MEIGFRFSDEPSKRAAVALLFALHKEKRTPQLSKRYADEFKAVLKNLRESDPGGRCAKVRFPAAVDDFVREYPTA